MPLQETFINPLSPAVFVFEAPGHRDQATDSTAAIAASFYDFESNVLDGPSGRAYAIPVHDKNGKLLSLSEIKWHVDVFLGYARQHKDNFFQVTKIACGPGLYSDEQVAPLFARAPQNVWLPGRWRLSMRNLDCARLIVCGTDVINDPSMIERELDKKTHHWNGKFELITDHSSNVAVLSEKWMRSKLLPITPFVPDIARFEDRGHHINRLQMAWYATHLIAFSDGKHEDTLDMIEIAINNGLRVGVVDYPTEATKLEILT